MESRATAIMLILSLAALLHVGAAAVADNTLRLPSDPVMADDGATRPWDCCDYPRCTEGSKGMWCGCADVVGKCAAACTKCRQVGGTGPVGYQCRETTKNGPGPKCNP